MKLLYLGDVMGGPGISIVERLLPKIKKDYKVDVVVAQSENVTNGKGINKSDFDRLSKLGVDFFTGGNHSFSQEEINEYLDDPSKPIIRPANYPLGTVGLGYKSLHTKFGDILFVSLLGQVVGKDASKAVDNPLHTIDHILSLSSSKKCFAEVINFHGDFSSEKLVIGYYLDGKVSAVIGDHWHIQTSDEAVLPKGTAHITDVGMCGSLHSSLGVKTSTIIKRWHDGEIIKNDLEEKGALQLNAVVVDIKKDGLAKSIERIRIVAPNN